MVAGKSQAQLISWFVENACPDHHVRGGPEHVMARHTAMRILDRYPVHRIARVPEEREICSGKSGRQTVPVPQAL